MSHYRSVGELPPKRHTLHHDPETGEPLFEEFIGEEGFSSNGSLLYHRNVPSSLVNTRPWDLGDLSTAPNHPLRPRHLRLPDLFPADGPDRTDMVRSRKLALANSDVRISYVVANSDSPLYSNGVGDELVFIEAGEAILESVFGTLHVKQGDNVVIPRVTIHRWLPRTDELRAICVEASGHIATPDRYRSRYGQYLEHSPITERDVRGPVGPMLASAEEAGQDTDVHVKHRSAGGTVAGSIVTYDHHPFDAVAWDGYLYPYAINYRDLSVVVGHVVQPPPTYQVFEGSGFVVCNFVPRPLEFHPQAIKVPYYHSNVDADADEVMFYFVGETAARKGSGIKTASLSLHPAAYTHGPRRQAYIDSVNLTHANETAFMVDTLAPLDVANVALACDDPHYPWTWSGRGPGYPPSEA